MTDTFAVLCITAAERAVRALAPVAGRGRWAIVRAATAAERRAAAHAPSSGSSLRSTATPAEIPPRTAARSAQRSVSAEGHPRTPYAHKLSAHVSARTSWSRTTHIRSSPGRSPRSNPPQDRTKPHYKYNFFLSPHTHDCTKADTHILHGTSNKTSPPSRRRPLHLSLMAHAPKASPTNVARAGPRHMRPSPRRRFRSRRG